MFKTVTRREADRNFYFLEKRGSGVRPDANLLYRDCTLLRW